MEQKILLDFEVHWREHSAPEISLSKQGEARAFLRPLFERMGQANEPMRILDVGCGDGVHAVVLAKVGLGVYHYFGMDLSPKAAASAQGRMRALNGARAEFQVGNALSLPYHSHSFDIVFSYGVIAYTGEPEAALGEMVRVCKAGGLIGVWLYPKVGVWAGQCLSLHV